MRLRTAKLKEHYRTICLMTMELNGYKIGAALGDGGMATVYKGLQLSLQRPVAIKVLKSKLMDHREIRKRFERESLIIARLNHPNIIHVIDQGITDDGRPYFVMEYSKSIGLDVAMRHDSMTTSRALDVFMQIAKALAYAHKNGVIHCDIKPENVLVDFEGFVRVLDFGIAQIFEDVGNEDEDGENFVMGSANYMAPEQRRSITAATEKSDLYALGVIMYLFFARQLPKGSFPPPSQLNASIPPELDELILHCLARAPSDRPNSADCIKHCLLRVLQGGHLDIMQKQRASVDVQKTFKLLDVIKESRHGSVYLFSEKEANSLFIIKKKPKGSPGFEAAEKLRLMDHANIVGVMGTSQNGRSFILVLEYCSGGSLAERLVKRYDLENFYCVAQQILSAMMAAAVKGIVHGNIRPTNILFDQNGCVKVSDFGLDEHYAETEVNWYAVYGEEKSESADVFSVGVIFYQMLVGEAPRWKGDRLVKVKTFADQPVDVQRLIRKMLSCSLERRIATFAEVSASLNSAFDSKMTIVRSSGLADVLRPVTETVAAKVSSTVSGIVAEIVGEKLGEKVSEFIKPKIPIRRLASLVVLMGLLVFIQVYLAMTGRLYSLLQSLF